MNYIGSKFSLLEFLDNSISEVTDNNFESFCDLFAGTSVVGSYFKKKGYKVVANDLQYYSYVLARHYIGNSKPLLFEKLLDSIKARTSISPYFSVCDYLNELPGIEGFIYNNFCPTGTKNKEFQRQYYTDQNGMKCDEIRSTIEDWKNKKLITDDEYYCLLATLLENVDKYANTASVYGAFLKHIKSSAKREMQFSPIDVILSNKENIVYNQDVNQLIKSISGDVLYLDPPYNQRQYSTNYHLLETIVLYDNPILHGKTGLRDYSNQKSKYCIKNQVLAEFSDLINNADFKYIFLSYNNEGLMSLEDIKSVMSRRGTYRLFSTQYSRFKADSDENRNHKSEHTYEYLHSLSVT